MENILQIKGEQWKKVTGYENYLVSNYGRVYSKYRNKLINPYQKKNNYFYVRLTDNKKTKDMRLHRLIAETFVENPDNKPYIHHKDVNKSNNHADNLMWVTMQEHFKIHKELKQQKKKGENNK